MLPYVAYGRIYLLSLVIQREKGNRGVALSDKQSFGHLQLHHGFEIQSGNHPIPSQGPFPCQLVKDAFIRLPLEMKAATVAPSVPVIAP